MRRLHQVCIARQCHLVHRLQMHKVALTGMRTSSQNYKCFKDTCSFFKLASLGITYMHVYVLFVRCKNASLVQTYANIHTNTLALTHTQAHTHTHTQSHTHTLTHKHKHTHAHRALPAAVVVVAGAWAAAAVDQLLPLLHPPVTLPSQLVQHPPLLHLLPLQRPLQVRALPYFLKAPAFSYHRSFLQAHKFTLLQAPLTLCPA